MFPDGTRFATLGGQGAEAGIVEMTFNLKYSPEGAATIPNGRADRSSEWLHVRDGVGIFSRCGNRSAIMRQWTVGAAVEVLLFRYHYLCMSDGHWAPAYGIGKVEHEDASSRSLDDDNLVAFVKGRMDDDYPSCP